jgi:ERCC4-related helicase
MKDPIPFCTGINLHVPGRIIHEDALRQEKTAVEILKRLHSQPGVILADEVGMGKTFVALAVAVSVALKNRGGRPVVVMVPSTLKEKWPNDFHLFKEKCLPTGLGKRITCETAEKAIHFLRLVDKPKGKGPSVIFLTHGAMSRGLNDPWVSLAIIRQSLHRKKNLDSLRKALVRNLGDLLQKSKLEDKHPDIWINLLKSKPETWLDILRPLCETDDEPVPEAVARALPSLDTEEVLHAVQGIPLRKSSKYGENILRARRAIKMELEVVWKECLRLAKLKLPLVILDEAHHLKNEDTKLASLFRSREAEEDAEEITRGPLGGVFERMLFLTATPFQLGHGELCSVLDRFDGICWKGTSAPATGRDDFAAKRKNLRALLDSAQESAARLDHAWGRLVLEDLKLGDLTFSQVEDWWPKVFEGGVLTPAAEDVKGCFESTKEKMNEAGKELRHWVIRHLKPRDMQTEKTSCKRRQRLPGRAIELGQEAVGEAGIAIQGDALLPFLLAARAASLNPESRPVFAEGLASSYEAFLHTRRSGAVPVEEDDDRAIEPESNREVNWYLDNLEKLIPRDSGAQISHPKVSATVKRVVDIWKRGEKCLVFCHYLQTGRVLRNKVSEAIQAEIQNLGSQKLGIKPDQVPEKLELLGKRFFDEDSPLRRAWDSKSRELINQFPSLADYAEVLGGIMRRYVRTPWFLTRYFPIVSGRMDARAIDAALETRDLSGMTLRDTLFQFLVFLNERCGEIDRVKYLDALKILQTGSHVGNEGQGEYEASELQGDRPEQLLANVRLVNGTTNSKTRQRLMLTFNTPFYPEILIASSVMAEGVDLHLNCRHIIHHDLCWNPSTLEQRTGRVDRIGAKAEIAGHPIQVYLPFIAETQDEKMYRVVMDRERWFNVVMGEDYKVDIRSTDKIANRIPFPLAAANELAFDLSVL